VSEVLNFVYSCLPLATLAVLAYRVSLRLRVPSGFFQLLFGAILAFMSVYEAFILVLLFESLYAYEATMLSLILFFGLILAFSGIRRLAGVISVETSTGVNFVAKNLIRVIAIFIIIFYIPLFFIIPRSILWRVGALFYTLNQILFWALFLSFAKILEYSNPKSLKRKILVVLSFYFLLEPVIYLIVVAFESRVSTLYLIRFIMALIGSMIAIYLVLLVVDFFRSHFKNILEKIPEVYIRRIKVPIIQQVKNVTLFSIVVIAFLILIGNFLIDSYLAREIENFAIDKTQIVEVFSDNLKITVNDIFELLDELSIKRGIADYNIREMNTGFAKFFSKFPGIVRHVSRVDETGILRYTYPPDPRVIGKSIRYQEHVQKFLIQKSRIISSPFIALQGYEAIAIYDPVFDDMGRFKGAVACLIDVKEAIKYFSRLIKGKLDEYFILDHNGNITFSSEKIGRVNFYEIVTDRYNLISKNAVEKIREIIESQNSGSFILKGRNNFGRKIRYAFSFASARFDGIHWHVMSVVNQDKLASRIQPSLKIFGIFAISFIIITFYFGWILFITVRNGFKLEDEIEKQSRELAESEEKYRELVENPFVGYYIIDENGFIFVNQRFAEITGYSVSELIGRSPEKLIHPDDREEVMDRFRRRLKGEDVPPKWELRGIRRDGKVIYIYGYSRRIIYKGKPAVQGIVLDVTREKIQEEAIRQFQHLESIGTLAAGIAHDFNNILQVIIGSTQLLRMKIENPDLRKYIDSIISVANRGSELSKRLLIFTRKRIEEAEILNLNELVREAGRVIQETFPKQVKMDMQLQAPDATIRGIRAEIQQVILNLTVNARDAIISKIESSSGQFEGKLLIRTWNKFLPPEEAEINRVSSGEYVIVSVIDNGIGMNEETRRRIFEPFFTTKRPEIGTGLGLSIIYGIVRTHGGFITVESSPGKGTRFDVYFPVAEKKLLTLRTGYIRDKSYKEKMPSILIIESDARLKTELKERLEECGFKAYITSDGVEAAKFFEEKKDDIGVVVLDIYMPRLNGKDMIAQFKILKPDIKIIIASENIAPEDEDIVRSSAGLIERKEYNAENLIKLLNNILT
jgi:PAS domain S-box-containing protein